MSRLDPMSLDHSKPNQSCVLEEYNRENRKAHRLPLKQITHAGTLMPHAEKSSLKNVSNISCLFKLFLTFNMMNSLLEFFFAC